MAVKEVYNISGLLVHIQKVDWVVLSGGED